MCISRSVQLKTISIEYNDKMFDVSPSISLNTQNDVVVVTRTVVQVEASSSRLAESELCRKSLPVELLAHFTVHTDVAAQEIHSGDNLCIRGPNTISALNLSMI